MKKRVTKTARQQSKFTSKGTYETQTQILNNTLQDLMRERENLFAKFMHELRGKCVQDKVLIVDDYNIKVNEIDFKIREIKKKLK